MNAFNRRSDRQVSTHSNSVRSIRVAPFPSPGLRPPSPPVGTAIELRIGLGERTATFPSLPQGGRGRGERRTIGIPQEAPLPCPLPAPQGEGVHASTTFGSRIGIMSLSPSCGMFGVPRLDGPNRLKPELQTSGSWKRRNLAFLIVIDRSFLELANFVSPQAEPEVSQQDYEHNPSPI